MKTVDLHYKYLQWHCNRLMIMIRVYSVIMKCHRKKSLIVPSDSNLWFGQVRNQATEIQIKYKSNQMFQNQFCLLKSNHHIWFNHDLILPITATDYNIVIVAMGRGVVDPIPTGFGFWVIKEVYFLSANHGYKMLAIFSSFSVIIYCGKF